LRSHVALDHSLIMSRAAWNENSIDPLSCLLTVSQAMASNTLVLYAMWGTLSATFGAWLVTLAQLIWVANERAKADVQVCGQGHVPHSARLTIT